MKHHTSKSAALTLEEAPLMPTRSIEVSIDGKMIGVFVPPEDESFVVMIGNIPRTYMRAHIMTGTEIERWQWQLPDIQDGQVISFRMVNAESGSGTPPHYITKRDTDSGTKVARAVKGERAKAKPETKTRKK